MEQHQVKTEEKPVADGSGSYDDDLVDVATETFERETGLALESSVAFAFCGTAAGGGL